MTEHELIQAAIRVRDNAYAPFSNFRVGAALLTDTGELFLGCNVENSSFGLSVCAERNAVANMIAHGRRCIREIAIAATPLATPCGACRQTLIEFGANVRVVSVDAENVQIVQTWLLSELIPDHFGFRSS